MIRHIVLFSAKDPRDAGRIKEGLQRLAEVPGAERLEVSLNAKRDALSREIDVVLYSEFADWAELDAYQSHPTYQEAISIVRPLRDQRVVVDYETTGWAEPGGIAGRGDQGS